MWERGRKKNSLSVVFIPILTQTPDLISYKINDVKTLSQQNNSEIILRKSVSQNPFYLNSEEQSKLEKQVNDEKLSVIEHNKITKQFQSPFENDTVRVKDYGEQAESSSQNALSKIFGGIDAHARGLNNNVFGPVLYMWDNQNLAMDIPWGNITNGQQLELGGRHGNYNQRFWFDSNSNQIKAVGSNWYVTNKCLDISGGNFVAGSPIILWDCHSGLNQKWFFYGTSLRSMGNSNLCLDATNGVVNASKLIVWSCHGQSNQRFVSGENHNFGQTHIVGIHAADTNFISVSPTPGHVLLSYWVGSYSSSSLHNTQSAWPGYDQTCYSQGAINDMCDNDASYVDRQDDINYAYYSTSYNFRTKTVTITKRLSDVYRNNSGYRWNLPNFGLNNVDYSVYATGGNTNQQNCSTFSVRTWNYIMDDSGLPRLYPRREYWPGDVYAII